MELYGIRLLPSLSRHLVFLSLTACCVSVFPCCLCLDTQYQYCQNTSKCGSTDIFFPFGVGNRGCGLPDSQINCVQNSSIVIMIQSQNYTILNFPSHPHGHDHDHDHPPPHPHAPDHPLFIAKGDNCQFLDDPFNMQAITSSQNPDTVPNIQGKQNMTLTVYKCEKQIELYDWGMEVSQCNESIYLALEETNRTTGGCSLIKKVSVEVGLMNLNSPNDTNGDNSCWSCDRSDGICGYNISEKNKPFVCYCEDGPRAHQCPVHGRRMVVNIIIGCSVGGAAALIMAVSLAYYLKRRKAPSGGLISTHLPGRELGNLPLFSYDALRQSTNCFHKKNELGVGGFGSVYLGKLWDGRIVAVKRLYQDNSRRLEQFLNEVRIFSTLNHPHLVRLYGCTPADSPELLLVYEFVPNGTLADHLHGNRTNPKGLPWKIRLNVAIQTSRALAFLHGLDPPIFHRDVKSSNILLDDNLDVKVADFGLCRLVPVNASHVTTIPQGTPGYVDPEYYQCYHLTDKSDVYSFGVVLMEIISAKIAMDINRSRKEINLANFAITKIQEGDLHELVDPQLHSEVYDELKVTVGAVAELAFRCLASERDDRPYMKEVVAQLEEIRNSYVTSTDLGEQQFGSFSVIKQPLSPTSVQDKWPSISSTFNTSS